MAKLNTEVKETKGNKWRDDHVCSHRNIDAVLRREHLGNVKSNMVQIDKKGGVSVNGYNILEELIYDYTY